MIEIHQLNTLRMVLVDYALEHTLDELLTKTLDEICSLIDSPIGFYHFVEADQKTISLQQWSTQTLKEFCRAAGRGLHYSLELAGVWADCVRERRPVIHNDYKSLPNRKELPAGHAEVIRELVVPVMRSDKIVAILGVGNKTTEYSENDIESVLYVADITWHLIEQKKAYENLLASEQRYRTLFQCLMDAFILVDMKGRIKGCNDAFCSLLGYTEDELKQLSYEDITPEKWQKMEIDIVREQVLPKGSSALYEKEYLRKDGGCVPVELRTFLVVNEEGRGEGMSAVVRDISERKKAETERNKLQEQLHRAQKMEAIGQLAAGIAHEINTPVQFVNSNIEFLSEASEAMSLLSDSIHEVATVSPPEIAAKLQAALEATDWEFLIEEAPKAIEQSRNGIERISSIIRAIKNFSHPPTKEKLITDVNSIIETTLILSRNEWKYVADVTTVLAPDLPGVPCLIDEIGQVILNLLVNAAHAIADKLGPAPSSKGQIHISTKAADDHVEIRIQDTGAGIPVEIQDRIFDPFFTTKEVGKGTGQGLAISQDIVVVKHGGSITFETEKGAGTTFLIRLPCEAGSSSNKKHI